MFLYTYKYYFLEDQNPYTLPENFSMWAGILNHKFENTFSNSFLTLLDFHLFYIRTFCC